VAAGFKVVIYGLSRMAVRWTTAPDISACVGRIQIESRTFIFYVHCPISLL
jgi:hypothetical protein